jgi:hypothetical protein
MAQPARRATLDADAPPVDPEAIERAYRLHRARRRIRIERRREHARARIRFLATVLVLIAIAVVLLLTLWHEVQSVFGL